MSLRLLSWNVRELNNPQKREVCKNLLKEWKCDIVCFQETKLSSLNFFVVRSLWGSPFLDWVVLDAVNTARGCYWFGTREFLKKLIVLLGGILLMFYSKGL